MPLVVSLGLKYRHSNLSVAGHSPLASESTISASLESHALSGPLGLHEKIIINHDTHCPRRTRATYVPTQELERTTDFQSRRFMYTNAVKSTTTGVNAIDCHIPGHHLLVCAQLCIAAEIWTSSGRFIFQRQIRLTHDRAHEWVRVSRTVTGDFLSCQSTPRTLTTPKPLLNLNERLCIDHYEDLGEPPLH